MDHGLILFTDALKKILTQLKPTQQPLSFLLCIGKEQQGKTTLLKQSSLTQAEIMGESPAELYYNAHGIIVDLNEQWINSNHVLLHHLIKEINRCHRTFKINGLLLVIDMNLLYNKQLDELAQTIQTQTNLLKRVGQALDYRINTSIVLTKLDGIAGFSDFFEQESLQESNKPLGFSISWRTRDDQLVNNYRTSFEQFIQSLEQSILKKIHPVRSNIKRKLIREFPLQLMQLRSQLQALLQALPTHPTCVQAIYFTSAEQGGISIDHLNHKIQQEYALMVRDQFPQATNHRAYFIEGALCTTQAFTKQYTPQAPATSIWHMKLLGSTFGLFLLAISAHYLTTKQALNRVNSELLAYESSHHAGQDIPALLHLTQASTLLKQFTPWLSMPPAMHTLKVTLMEQSKAQLKQQYIPNLLTALEKPLLSRQEIPATLYHTLKIYLLLGDPHLGHTDDIMAWFQDTWKAQGVNKKEQVNQTRLLREILSEPRPQVALNQQIIHNVRTYLNALPRDYLYYSIVKQQLSSKQQPLEFTGLTLPERSVPYRLTKAGFKETLATLPHISHTLQAEHWVLGRQDLDHIETHLLNAYCDEYVVWWQNLLRKTSIQHIQTYEQAYTIAQKLTNSNSLSQFLEFIQAQTRPDFSQQDTLFNRRIASQFIAINLMSLSSINELVSSLHELQPFLMTLTMLQDQGRTAFSLTKAYFNGQTVNNPLTTLATKAAQFPEPIASWTKQLPDEIWFLLMNETKQYINAQWQQQIYTPYQERLAHRYPLNASATEEIKLTDFNNFFSPDGLLARFTDTYLKPYLDTSSADWTPKSTANYRLPIPKGMLAELIRANVITAMFFPNQQPSSQIKFTLEKMNLDPVVTHLSLTIGNKSLEDSQKSQSITHFTWPTSDALLTLTAIDGNQYELEEQGPWAFFKLLQKVNVLVDRDDSTQMQILFEINGNSGRYALKTQNDINPFIPGILNEFHLKKSIIGTA